MSVLDEAIRFSEEYGYNRWQDARDELARLREAVKDEIARLREEADHAQANLTALDKAHHELLKERDKLREAIEDYFKYDDVRPISAIWEEIRPSNALKETT